MNALTDNFGRVHTYLRVSVTDRCNLRCRYCMPPQGVPLKSKDEILTLEEIARLIRLFSKLGVRKVRLTGGEPLVRSGIEELIRNVSQRTRIDEISMTTNGVLLAEKAQALKEAGLSRLNVSLDTLREERFGQIALRDFYSRVRRGIKSALSAGFVPLKLNVVVMGGVNDDEILDFVEFVADKPITVRFIEYMPFKSNGWTTAGLVPYPEMREKIEKKYRLIPIESENGNSGVSKDFAIPGFVGGVGFIASISEPFCGDCNRLRLTADGFLKPCLFSPAKVNLRDALRNGLDEEELAGIIRGTLSLKWEEHPPMEELSRLEYESMVEVGG